MASTHFRVQTDGLHGGGVVGICAVTEGLSTAAKAAKRAERAVVVGIVHRWSLVVHYHSSRVVRIVSGGEEVRKKRKEGMKTI
jgi:hypothetical protein